MTVLASMQMLGMSLLDRLSGLSGTSWSDSRAMLGWRSPLPAWAWALIILTAAALSAWSYHRLLGSRFGRMGLALIRGLILLAVVALLAGPMLVVPQEKVDPDWLLVLIDRSGSMGVKDMPGAQKDGPPVSRQDAIYKALAAHRELFGADKLGKERHIVWLGFDADAYRIKSPIDPAVEPGPPEGQATNIRSAIEQGVQLAAGHPISAVILMTDGRTSQDTGLQLVQQLRQQAVSVLPVPLGTPNPNADLAVAEVDALEKAFINDPVPVTVWIDHYPADAPVDASRVHVRLVDTVTGKVLDEKTPDDADLSHPVRLNAQSATVGPAKWRVELRYEPKGSVPADQLAENKQRELTVGMIDRALKVLYVDGYPRWEYRYLKNMILREKSMQSSILLLSADRAFAQEGTIPIARLPQTAEELRAYDVVVVGDVPSSYFSQEQLRLLQDQVANEGTGLLWIGGAYQTPTSYDGTALAALLPMRHPGLVARVPVESTPIAVKPTPLAETLNVLRIRSAPGEQEEASLWPSKLPGLLWAQQLGDLKPGAEVLADGFVEGGPTSGTMPIVVRMRYGAGQSLYVATDDTSRWRYGRGELYFEQFWTQLIRMLGRNRIQQDTQRVRLEVSSRRVDLDQPTVLRLRIDDPLLVHRDLTNLAVSVSRADDPAHAALERAELLPKATNGGTGDTSDADAPRQFEAIWRPGVSGKLLLRLSGPGVDDLDVTQNVEVFRPDDELRQTAPDKARLEQLAKDTGGKLVALDHLEDLSSLVPNRARRTPDDIREPLWNSYLALILMISLLTLEWIGRKIVKLS